MIVDDWTYPYESREDNVMQPRFPEDPNQPGNRTPGPRLDPAAPRAGKPYTQAAMVEDLLKQTRLVTPEQAKSLARAVWYGERIA